MTFAIFMLDVLTLRNWPCYNGNQLYSSFGFEIFHSDLCFSKLQTDVCTSTSIFFLNLFEINYNGFRSFRIDMEILQRVAALHTVECLYNMANHIKILH